MAFFKCIIRRRRRRRKEKEEEEEEEEEEKADTCCSKCTLRLLFAVLFATADYDPFSKRTVTFKTVNMASFILCVINLTENALLFCDLEVNFPCNSQHNTTN
jgi:hypothetical protein